MSVNEKIRTIDNKIQQNKAQYVLDRQIVRIPTLSENVTKYKSLTDKDVLLEKDLLDKAATMKRFEYLLLGKELRSKTDIAKKRYQKLEDSYGLINNHKRKNNT